MTSTNEQYLHIQEQEQGSIIAEPSVMSEAQYNYILQLIDSCILANVQKDGIHESVENNNYTTDQATAIIQYLLSVQRNPLERVQDGELLLMSDLKQAVKMAVNDPRK